MARGPDANLLDLPIHRAAEGLNRMEIELTEGLEKVIDGAIQAFIGNGPFAYGIHQSLSPRMADLLTRRYRQVGWGDVRVTRGATGASVIVLHRHPPPPD